MFDNNKIINNIIEVVEIGYKKNCVGCGCNIIDDKIFFVSNNEKAVYAIPCCDDCKNTVYNILDNWSY